VDTYLNVTVSFVPGPPGTFFIGASQKTSKNCDHTFYQTRSFRNRAHITNRKDSEAVMPKQVNDSVVQIAALSPRVRGRSADISPKFRDVFGQFNLIIGCASAPPSRYSCEVSVSIAVTKCIVVDVAPRGIRIVIVVERRQLVLGNLAGNG
jgi:hypothetical protein